jgi:cytochrome c oxidase subunit 2
MGGVLYVMKPADYARWLRLSGTDRSLAARGEALFHSLGCSGCHSPVSAVHAPMLNGIYGGPAPLSDGRVVVVDDQYVRDSILQPSRDVAAGYAPIMPTFANLVSEDQVLELVAYVKSLKSPSGGAGS